MKKSQILQEIRKMKFEEVYSLRTEKRLSVEEAASILGVSDRTFRRYIASYKENGLDGPGDGCVVKAAHNAAPADEVIALTSLYTTSYRDYSAAHFYDKYCEQLKESRPYSWVKTTLQKKGVIKKSKNRGQHIIKRPRKPMVGMMIYKNAYTYQWVEGAAWDLVVIMNDAINEIYSAFFVDKDRTWSSFRGIEMTAAYPPQARG